MHLIESSFYLIIKQASLHHLQYFVGIWRIEQILVKGFLKLAWNYPLLTFCFPLWNFAALLFVLFFASCLDFFKSSISTIIMSLMWKWSVNTFIRIFIYFYISLRTYFKIFFIYSSSQCCCWHKVLSGRH